MKSGAKYTTPNSSARHFPIDRCPRLNLNRLDAVANTVVKLAGDPPQRGPYYTPDYYNMPSNATKLVIKSSFEDLNPESSTVAWTSSPFRHSDKHNHGEKASSNNQAFVVRTEFVPMSQ